MLVHRGVRASINTAICFAFAISAGSGPAPAHAQGRDLVIGTAAITRVMDPHKTVGEPGVTFAANVFEPLVRLNPTPSDGRGRHIPATAKSWKVAEDGLSIDFVLNGKAKFHDG